MILKKENPAMGAGFLSIISAVEARLLPRRDQYLATTGAGGAKLK